MIPDEFLQELAAAGFAAPVLVSREPSGFLAEHSHPFEAKALIASGSIAITCNGTTRVYCEGDIFHLAPEEPHSERYGEQGVSYWAGRKTSNSQEK